MSVGGCDSGQRTPPAATLSISELLGGADTLHERAVEPREFTFPRDHGPHPSFRTEWWYFTGNLSTAEGREFGYQLTFFRSALTDSASFALQTPAESSPWRTRHAWMAHFALADGGADAFHAAERFSRGAAGLGGAELRPDERSLRVWVDDWSAESTSHDVFPLRLRASDGAVAIDLVVRSGKPIVLHGERGLSRKGAERGNASYYYSLTRMPTEGVIRTSAGSFAVTGDSWLDREWSTSVLSSGVVGWDWLSLQLSDTTELMMYRLRRADGTHDPFSAATIVDASGRTRVLAAADFTMTPTARWEAPDGVAYPVEWSVAIPAADLVLEVTAPVRDQELNLAVRYWEGMVRAQGTRAGEAVTGRGYLEMTGYAGALDRAR